MSEFIKVTEQPSTYRHLEKMLVSEVLSNINKEDKTVAEAVEKAIEYNVVTVDLKADSKFGTNEVGDFISNVILSKDDLYFKSDNVQIGQSTIV